MNIRARVIGENIGQLADSDKRWIKIQFLNVGTPGAIVELPKPMTEDIRVGDELLVVIGKVEE